MGALDQVFSNQLINASDGQAPLPAITAPLRSRLMTANGSATANGTELATGGGYTSGTGAPTVTFAAAAGGQAANSSAITVTNMPAATVNGIELWDSSGTPRRTWWGALSAAKTTNVGDTFSVAIGALTLQFP